MVNERKGRELAQKIHEAVSWMNQQQTAFGRRFLAASWERMIVENLREMGANFENNSLLHTLIEQALIESEQQAARFKPTPATKSSIEVLEEVVINSHDSCAICMEKMVMGTIVTRMPCSHRFHRNCIVSWLERSYVCSLCRLKLLTT